MVMHAVMLDAAHTSDSCAPRTRPHAFRFYTRPRSQTIKHSKSAHILYDMTGHTQRVPACGEIILVGGHSQLEHTVLECFFPRATDASCSRIDVARCDLSLYDDARYYRVTVYSSGKYQPGVRLVQSPRICKRHEPQVRHELPCSRSRDRIGMGTFRCVRWM